MLFRAVFTTVALVIQVATAAAEITLTEGFTPNPMELQVELRVAGPRMYTLGNERLPEKDLGQLGFTNCGSSNTTVERPAVVFQLPRSMRDLRMLLTDIPSDRPLVLVMPDRRYQCVTKTIYSDDWPAGRYAIYVTTSSSTVTRRTITFDQPKRARTALFARFTKLPTLSSEATRTANPSYLHVPAAPAMPASTVGVGRDGTSLIPLVTLEITEPGNYTLGNPDLLVLDGAGAAVPTSSINDRWEHPFYKLAAGRYHVFGVVRDPAKAPTGWSLALANDTAPFRFANVTSSTLTASGPTVLDVRTATEGDLRRKGTCARLGRVPSLIVSVAEGEDYALGTFRTAAGTQVSWDVYRLDGAAYQDMSCGTTGALRLSRPGTYAVWAHAGDAGTPLAVIARPARVEPDPTYRPFDVAAGLPLAQRRIRWHYPFHGWTATDGDSKRTTLAASAEPLFLTAPEELFVTVTRTQGAVVAGEPLLVVTTAADRRDGGGANVVEVARYDGVVYEVAADSIVDTVARPAKLPKKPELVVAKTVSEAHAIAGAAEKPLQAALQKQYDDFHGCVGGWMAKHDPTWGKSYELVNLRTGRTMSDEKFKVAHRVCGEAKLLAAERKFVAGVNASRKKSASAYLASLKKRFQ